MNMGEEKLLTHGPKDKSQESEPKIFLLYKFCIQYPKINCNAQISGNYVKKIHKYEEKYVTM